MSLSIVIPKKVLLIELIIIIFLISYNTFYVSTPSSWYHLVIAHALFLLLAFYLIKENTGAEKTIRGILLSTTNRSRILIFYTKLIAATISFIIVPLFTSSFLINFFFGLDRITIYRIIIFVLLNLFVIETITLLHMFNIDYVYQLTLLMIYEIVSNLYSSIGVLVIGLTSDLGLLQNALYFYIIAVIVLYVLILIKGWLMK